MPPTTRKTRNTSLQPTSNTTALDTPAQSTRRSTRSTSLRPTSSRADTKRSSIPPAAVKTSASASGTDTAEASPAPASLHSEDEPDEEETPSSSSSTSTFVKVERIDEDMLSSATGQRTGLRGRNVEDVSELEEKGLLRHVDYDDDGSERETRRRDKGKEKETRVERVADYSDGSDEGLNNPRDRNAFALLVLLYLLQGIPLGLTFGTLPFIMKPHLSYSQLAVFSLSTWPYSLKLLWSPIVDAWFVPRWGRRKSWIVPVQAIVGVGLWYIGGRVESWLDTDEINVRFITLIFGSLILAAATQDIAVDGWALTLLSQQNLSYASTAQTIGLGIGNALAFTVFLAFNSPDFSNRYFRTEPQIYGLVSLGGYLRFWAVIFIIVTVGIAYFKTEDAVSEDDPDMDVRKVYSVMWSIIRLKNIQAFLVVLIVCKIGFQVNDSVTGLKLLEKGLLKEDLAVAVLLDFPIQMAAGWLVATWSRPKTGSARHPLTTSGTGDILRPWLLAFWARLAMAIIGSLVVWGFPKSGKVEGGYFGFVVATTLLSSLTSTVQFVGMSAFFTQIADPLIGGTYMTLLNTISNLGGTLPKPLVLRSVDLLTYGTCSVPIKDPSVLNDNCVNDPGRHLCNELGGHCIIQRDGYYIMNVVCVALGAFSLIYYILPTVKRLQALPMSAWRVKIPN